MAAALSPKGFCFEPQPGSKVAVYSEMLAGDTPRAFKVRGIVVLYSGGSGVSAVVGGGVFFPGTRPSLSQFDVQLEPTNEVAELGPYCP